MTLGGQNAGICLIEITVADRAFAIGRRERLPQSTTRFLAPIAKSQANNPPCLPLQSNPDPDFVVFGGHKRPQFIEFQNRPLARRFDGLTDRCQDFFSGLQQRSFGPSRLYGQLHVGRAVRAPTFQQWHVCGHVLGLWCRVCRMLGRPFGTVARRACRGCHAVSMPAGNLLVAGGTAAGGSGTASVLQLAAGPVRRR